MLCYVMLCYAMSCYVSVCFVMLCYVRPIPFHPSPYPFPIPVGKTCFRALFSFLESICLGNNWTRIFRKKQLTGRTGGCRPTHPPPSKSLRSLPHPLSFPPILKVKTSAISTKLRTKSINHLPTGSYLSDIW